MALKSTSTIAVLLLLSVSAGAQESIGPALTAALKKGGYISRAFPEYATGVDDGDALVFGPDGKGGASLVGRVEIADWRSLR